MADQTIEHEKLLKLCLLELSKAGFLAWKNSTGSLPVQNRFITFGLKGSSDILSVAPNGLFCGFECKTGKAVQNKHQKAFEKAVKKRNGHYIIIRSIEDLKSWLDTYSLTLNRQA